MDPAEYVAGLSITYTADIEKSRGKTGDLYVFQCGPYFKVGVAARGWKDRIGSIRCDNPFAVRKVIARAVPLIGLRWGERYVHEALARHHHSGEWFLTSKIVAVEAFKRGVTVSNLVSRRLETAFTQAHRSGVFGIPATQRVPRKLKIVKEQEVA